MSSCFSRTTRGTATWGSTSTHGIADLCAGSRVVPDGPLQPSSGALSVESNRGLDRIALGEQTLADRFRAGGYGTGMVGKWHNGLHDLRYHPNRRGFDEFAGFLNGGWVTGTGSLNTTASRCGRTDAT